MSTTETAGAISRSVTQLGSRFGLSPREFNVGLLLAGLYEGEPGAWRLTEKGERFAISLYHDNGYGGGAHRSWETLKWLEAVTAEMDLSESGIARIRQFLADRKVTQLAELKAARAAADAAFRASQTAKQAADAAPGVAGGTRARVIVGLGVTVTAIGIYTAVSLVRRRRNESADAPEPARDHDERGASPARST